MNQKTGFTLIELLAVVMIIAILTAAALPQYRRAIQRTQATEALTNLRTMFDSAMRYRAANSENPTTAKGLDVNFFEAQHNTNLRYTDIGFFRYRFSDDGIKSCLLEGNSDNTFCISMNYKSVTKYGNEYGPGTIFCQNLSGYEKFNYVCNYLGTEVTGSSGLYVI